MKHKSTDIIGAAMRNRNIVIIITVVLMVIGAVALKKMPRNEYPQFTIRQGLVIGIYPGATSAEVEAQLTKTVENYIFSYKEIKKARTYSLSREGVMYIFVELNDNVKNADQFWSKLKHGLNDLKMTLPAGVLALTINSDFGDTSALLITLSSDSKSYKELEEELKKLETECRKIPATSKIKHFGLQKEKIYVRVKPEMLNEYNIKSLSLFGAYQTNGMVNYAGVLKDGNNNLSVHLPANFQSEKDLAEQIVYSDPRGNVVRLKNIATIDRQNEDPVNYIRQNGKKTILLSLEMQPGNNIVEYGKEVDKALAKFSKTCPADIEVFKISELPKYVDESISNFMKEFLIAIIAVIAVTLLLLPFRIASVAGITVPVSVLITLGILYFFGIELHTVSLASLIIVLGMIVDNSIVIIDNHVEKIDHGMSPWHTAIKSAKDLFVPILTATLAIFAAYFPLMIFLPGTEGEFVHTLPIVVGVALAVSIAVATLLLPYLNFVFIKKGLKKVNTGKKRKTFLDILQGLFDRSLEVVFRYPKTVIATGIALVAMSVILFKNLDQQLFPEVERNQFAVEIYLPTGSSLQSTAKVVDSVAVLLKKDKRVSTVTSFIGMSSPRFHTLYAPNMPAPNYGQLLVNTLSNKATREVVEQYSRKYANMFPNAYVKMKVLSMQPEKSSIEIRISSDSIKNIRIAESRINEILKKTKHLTWVHTDWDQKQQNISVNLDRDKANRMGFSKGLVSSSIMIGLDGIPLTTIWENDYPVEVRLTQEKENIKNIKLLEDQYVTSPISFKAVPLRTLAGFSPDWTEGTIVHRNGIRTLTVLVDNDPKIAASAILNEIKPQIEKLNLPQETTVSFGGEYERQREVYDPMIIALGLSVVLIFFILLFQFKKEKLSLLIMSTMLLALPGAVIGLKVMGYPFSMTAFIGITSLCGIVVRNGIILIDYVLELRKNTSMSVYEAALAAGKRRMRPIFLTSSAAAVGVIPMVLSRSLLWGPLGTVICFGLIIAMVLTLYILPILYFLVYNDKKKKQAVLPIPVKTALLLFIFAFPAFASKTQAQNLSLDSCKVLALKNNYKIKEAVSEVRQSAEVKKSAFTKYFPNVSAGATAVKMDDYLVKAKIPQMNLPVYDGNPAHIPGAKEFAYFPGAQLNLLDYLNVGMITLAQPVFTGGRIMNGNKLAKAGYDISIEKQAMTQTEVLVKTEEYYWNIIALSEKLKTLDSYIIFLDSLQRDVNVAVKAGLIQRTDLLKVQLKLNELQLNRMTLLNGISLSKLALCNHIGITYDSNMLLVSRPEESISLAAFQSNGNEAISNRSEYKILKKVITVEELQKKMVAGEYLPQLSVGAVGMYTDMMDKTNQNALVFATLNIPLTDWWGGMHKLKENDARIESARYRLSETSDLLLLQLTKARNDLTESYFRISIAKKSIEQAKENLKVTSDNYHAGIIGMTELLEAQSALQQTQNALTDALCSFQVAKANYLLAINSYR